MGNPVAAGVSRISLINLTDDQTVETQVVLEVYDGENRIQVEFDTLEHLYEVVGFERDEMLDYFENNLFDSPDMDDPEDALLKMAATSGDEGLVTVPPEDDDEKLFDLMTAIFQKIAENDDESAMNGPHQMGGNGFIQSLVREQEEE